MRRNKVWKVNYNALGQLHNYLNDYKINARNKEIKTKIGRWTLLQTIKINKKIKIKWLNVFLVFLYFLDFMRKKEN